MVKEAWLLRIEVRVSRSGRPNPHDPLDSHNVMLEEQRPTSSTQSSAIALIVNGVRA